MTEYITLDDLISCRDAMDREDIPYRGRRVVYQGKDGGMYELSMDEDMTLEQIFNMPDWLVGLMYNAR